MLAKDYGRSDDYSPMQVQRTMERNGLNTRYTAYAMALFTNQAAFNLHYQDEIDQAGYEALRSELADSHFDGNADFSHTSSASGLGFDGAYGDGAVGGDFVGGGGGGSGGDS